MTTEFDPEAYLREREAKQKRIEPERDEVVFDPEAYLRERESKQGEKDKEIPKLSIEEKSTNIAKEHGVDESFVREAYQWMGEVTAKDPSAPDTIGDYSRVTAGALMRSFGAAIPQAAYRLLEDDPKKKAALEAVAKDVFDNQTGLDLVADIGAGVISGGGIVKLAGKAGQLANLTDKGVKALQAAAGVTEAGLGAASVSPGEELKGGALGVGLAGLATVIPSTYRAAKSLLGKGTKEAAEDATKEASKTIRKSSDRVDEFKKMIDEDPDALINQAEKALRENGEEIEAVGKILEDSEIKKSLVEMVTGNDVKAFETFQKLIKNNTEVADQSRILISLRKINPPSKGEISSEMDSMISRTKRTKTDDFSPEKMKVFNEYVSFLEKKKEDILNSYDELIRSSDPSSRLKVNQLEMSIKGIRGSVEDYVSFKQLRVDALRLVRESEPRLANLDLSNPKDLKKIKRYTDKAFRQGKIDGHAYRQMLLKDEMIRRVEAANIGRAAASGADIKDPAKSMLKEWVYTTRYMAADIDARINIGLGETIDRLISSYNNKTILTARLGRIGEAIHDATQKAGADVTKIARALENPEELINLSKAERKLAGQYRKLFNDIRNEANSVYGKNIPKLDNYLPQQALPLSELIPATKNRLEEVVAKLEQEDLLDLSMNKIRSMLKSDEIAAETKELLTDVLDLNSIASRFARASIGTVKDMASFVRGIDPNTFVMTRANFDAAAAFSRRGSIPSWARDWKADRLLLNYIDDMADSATMARSVSEFNNKVEILRKAGYKEAANYFNDYIQNVGGVKKGLAKRMAEDKTIDDITKLMGLDKGIAKEVISESIQTIYPANLGFSIKAYLRNLTQPFLMTATEIGASGSSAKYGQSLAIRATLQSAAKMTGGKWKDMISEVRKRGLATDAFRGDMRDQVRASVIEGMPPALRKFKQLAKKTSDAAMFLYSRSDYQNRYVTMIMADELGEDLVRGATAVLKGKVPDSAGKNAVKFIQGMEPGPRESVRRLLKESLRGSGPSKEDLLEIQNNLALYLVNKTQLTYGTVGMAKAGRFLGPTFSMFTTWPTNVSSEVIFEYARGGATAGSVRAMRKLIAPTLAIKGIKSAYEEYTGEKIEDSPRLRQLYADPSPLYSVFDVGNIPNPPAIDLASKAGAAMYEVAKAESADEVADSAVKGAEDVWKTVRRSHLPVISTLWNSFDRYYEILADEESPTKGD